MASNKIAPFGLDEEMTNYDEYLSAIHGHFDRLAWHKASSTDTKEGYKLYIAAFLDGHEIPTAKKILEEFASDEALWSETKIIDSLESYQQYIEANKRAVFLAEAAQGISNLKKRDDHWELARKKNSIHAYTRFLVKYPNSIYSNEAKGCIKGIEENDLWENTLDLNLLENYQQYLRKHPKGKHASEASRKISIIATDNAVWDKATLANTRNAYEEYIAATQGQGAYLQQAKSAVSAFEAQEEKLWIKTVRANNKNRYKQYMSEYPDGKYKAEAKIGLEEACRKESREEEAREKEAWNTANETGTIQSYELYMKEYIGGTFYKAAEDSIERIIKERGAAEKEAWDHANEVGTIDSYEEYLSYYPDAKFSKDAESKIQEIQEIQEIKYEKIAWDTAKRLNTMNSYQNYISKYSDSNLVRTNLVKAKAAIKDLRKEKAAQQKEREEKLARAEAEQEEEAAWKEAKHDNTVESFVNYLSLYKESAQYFDFAKSAIQRFEEEDCWAVTSELDTLDGYKHYIDEYPSENEHHLEKASSRIAQLESYDTIKGVVIMICIAIAIWYFDTPDTEFNVSPRNSDIYINGSFESIGYGDDYELSKKWNTIRVEKRGYATWEDTIKRGSKSVRVDLGKNHEEIGLVFYRDKEYLDAYEHFKIVADQGNVWFKMGVSATRIEKYKEAEKYYLNDGSATALVNIGVLYSRGNLGGLSDEDLKKMFSYYQKSSEKGNAYGHCYTANAYWKGRGVEKNKNKAALLSATKKFPDSDICDNLRASIEKVYK